jgi:hypothetical protein
MFRAWGSWGRRPSTCKRKLRPSFATAAASISNERPAGLQFLTDGRTLPPVDVDVQLFTKHHVFQGSGAREPSAHRCWSMAVGLGFELRVTFCVRVNDAPDAGTSRQDEERQDPAARAPWAHGPVACSRKPPSIACTPIAHSLLSADSPYSQMGLPAHSSWKKHLGHLVLVHVGPRIIVGARHRAVGCWYWPFTGETVLTYNAARGSLSNTSPGPLCL